ncbi:MAG: hypothetical protein FWE40_05665 [Oscillospiraceae bacterium]|nr:hypothetical protein [Oscillospiraceae bacterium]
MKKMTWLLAMLLAVVMLAGCASLLPHTRRDVPSTPTRGETNATGPFNIHVRGGNGFDFGFILRNSSDEIFFYSDAYRLYVYADSWQLHHEHEGSGAEYYLRPGAVRQIFVPWDGRSGNRQIEPGNYRLVMETLEIEFEQLHWSDEAGLMVQGAAQRQSWIDFIMAGEPAPDAVVSGVAATPAGMSFKLRNDSADGFFYGYAFDIARYDDGQWVAVSYIIDNAAWFALGFTLLSGETQDYEIDWAWLFGELAPGRYMFIRDLSLTTESFVETVNDGEQWSDIHHRYPTEVYLMIEFEIA